MRTGGAGGGEGGDNITAKFQFYRHLFRALGVFVSTNSLKYWLFKIVRIYVQEGQGEEREKTTLLLHFSTCNHNLYNYCGCKVPIKLRFPKSPGLVARTEIRTSHLPCVSLTLYRLIQRLNLGKPFTYQIEPAA